MSPISEPAAIVETVNADNYIAVKNIIVRQLAELDKLTSERKAHKEKIQNILDNNERLSEEMGVLKSLQGAVKNLKASILDNPEAREIKLHIAEYNEEIKDLQESLSNHLTQFAQITGTHVIEDADGVERVFSVKANIKPKQLSLF